MDWRLDCTLFSSNPAHAMAISSGCQHSVGNVEKKRESSRDVKLNMGTTKCWTRCPASYSSHSRLLKSQSKNCDSYRNDVMMNNKTKK